jgi:hypothetical protein
MRKLVVFLAILASLYAPCRFGLIVLDDAVHSPPDGSHAQTRLKNSETRPPFKKIISPRRFLRRPFSSKEKDFNLLFDRVPAPLPWTALETAAFFSSNSTQTIFFCLRAPPLPL